MTLDEWLSLPDAPTLVSVARDLSKNQDQLRQWRHGYGGKRAPPKVCAELERLSGGKVLCEHERPDLPWLRVDDQAWPGGRGRPVLDVVQQEAA